jgi:tripartite-type tricarboxylate transporter receptor subunit TctC
MKLSFLKSLVCAKFVLYFLSSCSEVVQDSSLDTDTWPSRPLRIIVPYGAGGIADVSLRLAADALSQQLGQAIVIENRPGAGGIAALSIMQNASADGYTYVLLSNGTTIAVSQFPDQLPPLLNTLQPVSSVAWFNFSIFVNSQTPIYSLADMRYEADTPPLRIGVINTGSTQYLAAELLLKNADLNATLIAYRSTPDVLAALLRQEVDMIIDAYSAMKGALEAGDLREIIAPDFQALSWNALYTHAEVPVEIIDQLRTSLSQALLSERLLNQYKELGLQARTTSANELNEQFSKDQKQWKEVMIEAGILEAL